MTIASVTQPYGTDLTTDCTYKPTISLWCLRWIKAVKSHTLAVQRQIYSGHDYETASV